MVRASYPDPTVAPGEKGDWVCVDMKAVAAMPVPVTLAALRGDPRFAEFALIRQSRLSVMAVSAAHWALICGLGGWKE